MFVGFYRRNGVLSASVEETRQQTGLQVIHEAVVGTDIYEILLKLKAKWNLSVEELDPDNLFIEEVH